jgi:hypothetical protein
MNSLSNYLIPYAVSNLIALLLIWLNWKRPRAGLVVFGIIFITAGIFNFYTASITPVLYLQYAVWALIDLYVEFIHGFFSDHAGTIVKIIAIGQILVGILLLVKIRIIQYSGMPQGFKYSSGISRMFFICIFRKNTSAPSDCS